MTKKECYSLNPEFFDEIELSKFVLLLQGENSEERCRWSTEKRYMVSTWKDREFCEKIQKEIKLAKGYLDNLKEQSYLL